MNFYAISALINFITSAVLGIFVIYKSRKAKNFSFFIFCFFVAFWSFFYYLWQFSTDSETALFWCRVLMAGAIFIPVAYLHFVYAMVEILDKRKRFLIFSYFLFFLFLFADTTSYFINHVEPILNFKFWPIAGPVYTLFLVVWFFYVIYSTYLLFQKYKISTGIIRLQIRYVMIGMIIGFAGGSTNYFLWYRIPIPPIANVLVSVYVGAIAYAILKYRLMDIRIVARKTFIYIVSAGFAYGVFYFLIWFYDSFLGGVFSASAYASGLFIAPIFVLVFLWFYETIQKFANRYFFFTLYNYQQTINNLSQKLNYLNDLDEIVALIVDTVKQSMQLDRAGVLLFERQDGVVRYKIAKVIGFDEHSGISLLQDNFLTKYLQEKQKPLVREELSLLSRDSDDAERKENFANLEVNMKRVEASLCLPLMSNKNLIGIIVLGSKISRDAYTKEDLELLSTLSYQAGIAIDNARLYEEIYDLNKNLQQKVDEQTKEIRKAYEVEKKAKEELELLDKSKNQFLLTIQHHLRTPLTSMMGYTDLLLKGAFGKQSAKTKKVIGRFKTLTDNLIKMVNEFLDITQFQLGKEVIILKPNVQIGTIVKKIVGELKFEAETKGIYLKLEKTKNICTVKADAEKIKAALFNVFDNAVKYTKEGGVTITINPKSQIPNPKSPLLAGSRQNAGQIQNSKPVILIMVKDTGIGLAPENLKNLFNKTFERGEEAKKTFATGRGIGLYIASEIVKAHGGRVWAESAGEGKGSTFYIELPVE